MNSRNHTVKPVGIIWLIGFGIIFTRFDNFNNIFGALLVNVVKTMYRIAGRPNPPFISVLFIDI